MVDVAADGGLPYEELGELYDAWCAEVDEDVAFYLHVVDALADEVGRSLRVVELGAGSGRISVPVAERGHAVTAVEASRAQLDRLIARAGTAGVAGRVRTQQDDLRRVASSIEAGSVDLVIAPFRTLLHVTSQRDAVLDAVRTVLAPGGVFAFDVFHPTTRTVHATGGRWMRRRSEPTATGAWQFDERAGYEPAEELGSWQVTLDVRCTWEPAKRIRRSRSSRPDPAADDVVRAARLDLVSVPAAAWLESLTRARFDVDGAYGWFDGRPLSADDEDSAWVVRAPVPGSVAGR